MATSHFLMKMCVFQLLSAIKVKLVDKMMQSTYLCVILLVKPTINSRVFFFEKPRWRPVWWRHRPPATPPPIKHTSYCRVSTEGKIVSKYWNISKTEGGRGKVHQLPSPLYHCGGMLYVCLRGLRITLSVVRPQNLYYMVNNLS